MFFLGIDIGKNNHVASLIDDKGKPVFKAFSFTNSTIGANSLLDNFVIHVINPIQTDGWRNATQIRKHKTDAIDSMIIADFIRYGDLKETQLASEEILELRDLTRFRNYQVSSISDLKRKTICVLDQVFPEYEKIFSDVFGKTSKEILMTFESVSDFADISTEKFEKILENITLKGFAKKKFKVISEAAKTSFGISYGLQSLIFQLRQLIAQINFIEQQVKQLEKKISALLNPITTIPGIGEINGATILSEIGDIHRFDNPKKLVAFAGLDASVKQSGDSNSDKTKMSKRGSPYLRTAIFSAALVASNCDPVFKAFYLKKLSEGKHHLTCVGAVARKLCYTIHAILSKNCPYEIQLNP